MNFMKESVRCLLLLLLLLLFSSLFLLASQCILVFVVLCFLVLLMNKGFWWGFFQFIVLFVWMESVFSWRKRCLRNCRKEKLQKKVQKVVL